MASCVWCRRTMSVPLDLAALWRWQPLSSPAICAACQRRLCPLHAPQCPQCSRQQTTAQVCQDCLRWRDGWHNRAIFPYDDALKAYMHQYKFQGDYQLRRVMQPYLRAALEKIKYDVLVPIPITPQTQQIRGFNQVTGWLSDQRFCAALTADDGKKGRPQSHKTRQERLQSPQPFQLRPAHARHLKGQHVLLLDDVYTTGRTLRHAATQIYLGGSKAVTSLTLAR